MFTKTMNFTFRSGRIIAGTVLVLLSAHVLIQSGCTQPNKYEAPPPPAVTVSRPVARDVVNWAEFTGLTEESARVDIQARVEGYLDEVKFVEGDNVAKDQLLYVIDQRPFKAALDKANANLSASESRFTDAKREFERYEKLFADKVVSEADFDQRRTARDSARESVNVAKAAVVDAELNLAYTVIKAPMDGRIGRNNVDPGNVVGPTRGILTSIVTYHPMNVNFNINERDLLRIRKPPSPGNEQPYRKQHVDVYLGLSTDVGYPYKGRLDFADLGVDPQTGNFRVRAIFDNANRALLPGLFSRVRVPLSEVPGALLVSESAIGQDQSGYYVMSVGADNVVAKQPVHIGAIQDDKLRVIEAGLSADDRVVVNGLQRARPGAKVSPADGEMPRLILPSGSVAADSLTSPSSQRSSN